MQSKVLLSGSSLVYQLCQRSQISCSELPQVQTFIKILEETLKESCREENPSQGQTVGVLHTEHGQVMSKYGTRFNMFIFQHPTAFLCAEICGKPWSLRTSLHSSAQQLDPRPVNCAGNKTSCHPRLQTFSLLG